MPFAVSSTIGTGRQITVFMWLPGALAPLLGCHANVKCACSGKTGIQHPNLNAKVNLTEHSHSGTFQQSFPSVLKTKRNQCF